jgi:hypothetical protein
MPDVNLSCYYSSFVIQQPTQPQRQSAKNDYSDRLSDTPRPSKKHKTAYDSSITIASVIIESGAGVVVAKQLSERLGRIVLPDLQSLANAMKIYMAQSL